MQMKNIFKILLIFTLFSAVTSCDLYPDWESYVEYSETYPVSGEYYVRDFYANDSVSDWYKIYIYNKSYNPTGDSVWIDNITGHPTGGTDDYPYKFKIKTRADLDNLSFNCERAGNVTGSNTNPLDSAVTITITNSIIYDMSEDISDATPDSIYFEFTYFDKFGVPTISLQTAGHRKTGWEDPQNDDNM